MDIFIYNHKMFNLIININYLFNLLIYQLYFIFYFIFIYNNYNIILIIV